MGLFRTIQMALFIFAIVWTRLSAPSGVMAGEPKVEPRGASQQELLPTKAIGDVAVAPDGTLWLATAPKCGGNSGISMSPYQTWISADNGRTWVNVPVSEHPECNILSPVRLVLPDPKKAGRILVWDSICPNSHYNEGGSVFVTEDGGWSWKRMKLPKPLREWVVDQPLDVGAQISELKMINGDFNRLEIRWNNKGWYRTADGGKTWKAIKASAKGAKAVRSPNKTLVSTLAIFHHHFQAA